MLPDHAAVRFGAATVRLTFRLAMFLITVVLGTALIVLATGMGTNGSGNRRNGW